jgi:hypothetical protein
MSQQENRDESIAGNGNQITRVEISERTLSIIAIVFSSVAIVLSMVTTYVTVWQIHEAKQVQVQLMYFNAIALREGLVQPGDMVFGPEGNLEYKQHELKHK